jgi:hypothetical protein
MDVRAAGLLPVVSLTGPEMFQSETVTFLNDMCLFAPATLLDPGLVWEEPDRGRVGVRFINAGVTVRAELSFNSSGELIDFVSDDRYRAARNGALMTKLRWSTPVRPYRAFGPLRIWSGGEARWHTSSGSFAYIELELDDVEYNVRPL